MGKEEDRNFMRTQCKLHERPNALPPQIFNDEEYCGDYDDFEAATEDDKLMQFLKLEDSAVTEALNKENTINNVETGESEAVEA